MNEGYLSETSLRAKEILEMSKEELESKYGKNNLDAILLKLIKRLDDEIDGDLKKIEKNKKRFMELFSKKYKIKKDPNYYTSKILRIVNYQALVVNKVAIRRQCAEKANLINPDLKIEENKEHATAYEKLLTIYMFGFLIWLISLLKSNTFVNFLPFYLHKKNGSIGGRKKGNSSSNEPEFSLRKFSK